jgi:hypothetical protein
MGNVIYTNPSFSIPSLSTIYPSANGNETFAYAVGAMSDLVSAENLTGDARTAALTEAQSQILLYTQMYNATVSTSSDGTLTFLSPTGQAIASNLSASDITSLDGQLQEFGAGTNGIDYMVTKNNVTISMPLASGGIATMDVVETPSGGITVTVDNNNGQYTTVKIKDGIMPIMPAASGSCTSCFQSYIAALIPQIDQQFSQTNSSLASLPAPAQLTQQYLALLQGQPISLNESNIVALINSH